MIVSYDMVAIYGLISWQKSLTDNVCPVMSLETIVYDSIVMRSMYVQTVVSTCILKYRGY